MMKSINPHQFITVNAPVLIIALLMTFSGNVFGQTSYYVSPTGSDDTGDGTEANPWKTINTARFAASDGDTLKLMDDDDEETDDFNEVVFINKEIVLMRADDTGPNPQLVPTSKNISAVTIAADNVTIDGLDIYGTQADPGAYVAGIHSDEVNNSIVKNCRVGWATDKSIHNGIFIEGGGGHRVFDNSMTFFDGEGIRLETTKTLVRNNTVDSDDVGLVLLKADSNVVHSNFFSGGYRSIVVSASNDNLLYLNDFVGPISSTPISNSNNWVTPFAIPYQHGTGVTHTEILGNYYEEHTNADTDNDGIADAFYSNPFFDDMEPQNVTALSKSKTNFTLQNDQRVQATQVVDTVSRGTNNNEVLKIIVYLKDSSGSLPITKFSFNTNGTDNTGDIAHAETYSSGLFDDSESVTSFGSVGLPSGAFDNNGTLNLEQGFNYFWLKYDIAEGALFGNTIDAELTSVIIDGNQVVPDETAPTGALTVKNPNSLPGSSVMLDGNGDYIDLGGVGNEFSGQVDFTAEFWFKGDKDDQPDPGQVTLFGIHTSDGNNSAILFMGEGSTQNGFPAIYINGYKNLPPTQIGDNKWHHAALVQDIADSEIRLYIDGKLSQTISTLGITIDGGIDLNTTDQWSIGQEYDGGSASDFFKGSFDEIRIWKSARTGEEIRANMFQTIDKTKPDLAAYYKLNKGSGTSPPDYSPNAYDANFNGEPSWSADTHPFGAVITGTEGWRMMSSPVDGASYNTLLDTLWTQGFTGADVDHGTANVFTWTEGDGAQDTTARGWDPPADATNTPNPGQGFLVYVYNDQDYDGTNEGFPKIIKVDNNQNNGTVSPSLTLSKQGGTYKANRDGWNLVSNPYGATIDWAAASGWTRTNLDGSFYIWNDAEGAYQSWNGSSGTLPNGLIAPWQGFWVKANNNGTPGLEFTDDVRSAGGEFLKDKPAPQIKFELVQPPLRRGGSGGAGSGVGPTGLQSSAVVMFAQQATPGKDRLDAWKLQSLNQQYLSLYTTDTERHALDINALPTELEQPLELHLDFKGSHPGGEYTLSWNPQDLPDGWTEGSIKLTDLHTDRILNLHQAGEYSFEVDGAKEKTRRVSETLGVSKPTHGPVPTVLKAKANNPRFLLSVNPQAAGSLLAEIPKSVELSQNYPNPFNPETVIRYGVPGKANIQLNVYDLLGRKVRTLIDEQKSAGRYEVSFNGSRLASGLYFYKLKVGPEVLTKKMMLIK